MAARAPFRCPHARNLLHVLNAFPVPLIVERRKMMRRAVPLFVNIRVAPLARIRLHEIFRGNVSAVLRLRRAWEKFPLWSVSLAIHGRRRRSWIADTIRVPPQHFTRPPGPR